jgi:sugar/nucleoside kinase (ribokinase family)
MAKIVIAGNINVETNLRVERFPVAYNPAQFTMFGIQSNVSGVGYNVAKSLHTLGNEVRMTAFLGDDMNAGLVTAELQQIGIDDRFIERTAAGTAQAVILYDVTGKRQIFSDLKNVQDLRYPEARFREAAADCDWCVLTNLNFSRYLLGPAKQMGKWIACDVQAISGWDDEYNRDFVEQADVLFFSNDRVGGAAKELIREAAGRFPAQVIVTGMGPQGVLMYVRETNWLGAIPTYQTRPVVNAVGAGDSLFSSFLHSYAKSGDAQTAIRKAMLYASWKIGESGGAKGFLDEASLELLYERYCKP